LNGNLFRNLPYQLWWDCLVRNQDEGGSWRKTRTATKWQGPDCFQGGGGIFFFFVFRFFCFWLSYSLDDDKKFVDAKAIKKALKSIDKVLANAPNHAKSLALKGQCSCDEKKKRKESRFERVV
jgi:hypothetical protein